MSLTIIAGGQTGVDRAALDVAESLNLINAGDWYPRDRLAGDGRIQSGSHLQETHIANYQEHTEWNVRNSDATLILVLGELQPGTLHTIEMAKKHNKPHFLCSLENNREANFYAIMNWFDKAQIRTLNIAGPRSEIEGIYEHSLSFLFTLFLKILSRAEY